VTWWSVSLRIPRTIVSGSWGRGDRSRCAGRRAGGAWRGRRRPEPTQPEVLSSSSRSCGPSASRRGYSRPATSRSSSPSPPSCTPRGVFLWTLPVRCQGRFAQESGLRDARLKDGDENARTREENNRFRRSDVALVVDLGPRQSYAQDWFITEDCPWSAWLGTAATAQQPHPQGRPASARSAPPLRAPSRDPCCAPAAGSDVGGPSRPAAPQAMTTMRELEDDRSAGLSRWGGPVPSLPTRAAGRRPGLYRPRPRPPPVPSGSLQRRLESPDSRFRRATPSAIQSA